MKYYKSIITATAAIISIGLGLWGWSNNQYKNWKEEVQLSDGRVITIIQKRKHISNYGTDQSWITFSLPEMDGEQTWHSYLIPMRIDVHDGKVYAYGRPRGPKQVAFYQYPSVCIVGFSWENSEFIRIPLKKIPKHLLESENVYPCIPKNESEKISITDKSNAWCPPAGDRQQFTKFINFNEYKKACDDLAMLDRATHRSD